MALKVPHRHLVQDAQFRARFRREAALGARLRHPRIVPILTPDPAEDDLWLAMAFIKGVTLDAFLAAQGPLPVPWAVRIGLDAAGALAHAHAQGVVHRDLKPANLMLNAEGAWVMDFGVARDLDAALTTTTMFIGTPGYAAPEALLDAQVGPAADRYALGLLLFEMLAGRPPFEASGFRLLEAHRTQAFPDLAALRPEVPEALCGLVARLGGKDPEARPSDAEVLACLEALSSSWPPPAGVLPA